MQGDAKARQARLEDQVLSDYLAAQMRVMAGAGKLGPLERWLEGVRPPKPRSVRDMILALQDAQARGASITIRKVEG
jgi:hypothetical protein